MKEQIVQLFKELNKHSVQYVVPWSYGKLPYAVTGTDIDIYCADKIMPVLETLGYQCRKHPAAQYMNMDEHWLATKNGLEIDIWRQIDYKFMGKRVALDNAFTRSMMEERVLYKEIWIPRWEHTAAILICRGAADKGFKDSYRDFIKRTVGHVWDDLKRVLKMIHMFKHNPYLLEPVKNYDWEYLERVFQQMKVEQSFNAPWLRRGDGHNWKHSQYHIPIENIDGNKSGAEAIWLQDGHRTGVKIFPNCCVTHVRRQHYALHLLSREGKSPLVHNMMMVDNTKAYIVSEMNGQTRHHYCDNLHGFLMDCCIRVDDYDELHAERFGVDPWHFGKWGDDAYHVEMIENSLKNTIDQKLIDKFLYEADEFCQEVIAVLKSYGFEGWKHFAHDFDIHKRNVLWDGKKFQCVDVSRIL